MSGIEANFVMVPLRALNHTHAQMYADNRISRKKHKENNVALHFDLESVLIGLSTLLQLSVCMYN